MVLTSREQALCTYYMLDFNEENAQQAAILFKNEHKANDEELCYVGDSRVPVVAKKSRVLASPTIFTLYPHSQQQKVPAVTLRSPQEVKAFVNMVYLPFDELLEDELYEEMRVTTGWIHESVALVSTGFASTTKSSFASMMGRLPAAYLTAAEPRSKNAPVRYHLSVLRTKYHACIIDRITKLDKHYQDHISDKKDEGYEIVGYCRKSVDKTITYADRRRLLERMVEKLKSRSMASKVFVSFESQAHTELASRDKNARSSRNQLGDGDTQSMLTALKDSTNPIILVILDYAGLTTNTPDLKNFLLEFDKVHYIYIDKTPWQAHVEMLATEQILRDSDILNKFDCRSPSRPRSL
ncbi:hypothetical protein BC940DRAFT_347512 [Gongronella butleri]|nr:hypothetical protein BC940DRAFT_347512 [Gongronella butleri]